MKIQKGFTLVELLVTLTVIVITLTFAVPAMRSFLQNNKAVTQTNQLVTALNFGRSEAVKRRMQVVVCAFNADLDGCAAGTAWDTNGWMVFADVDSSGAYGGSDLLLKQWNEIQNVDDINVTASTAKVTYVQTGALSGGAEIGIKVSVDDAIDPDGADRCVKVLTTGRVEYEKMEDGDTCP